MNTGACVAVVSSPGAVAMVLELPAGSDVRVELTRDEALQLARRLGCAVLKAWPECRACLGHGVVGDGHPDPDAPCPACEGHCYEGVCPTTEGL